MPAPLTLRFPATSANLGPGFDALGLALGLNLHIRAEAAPEFSIHAEGRNVDVVSGLERNLMLQTYRSLAPDAPALSLKIHNEIPLGMGCGSSAAALLAGVSLASHFGALAWTPTRILEEACRREGHPDNVAACFYGGLTCSAMDAAGKVTAATFAAGHGWRFFLALPSASLATEKARALLPALYSRADAVHNVQATALLVSAFALGRLDLLQSGTQDRMHQPFRAEACPLLVRLLPLAGQHGIASVTLSGAGPSVLLIAAGDADRSRIFEAIHANSQDDDVEVLETNLAQEALVTR